MIEEELAAHSSNSRFQFHVAAALLGATAITLLACSISTADRPTQSVVFGSLALTTYAGSLLFVTAAAHGRGLGLAAWKLGPWSLVWYCLAFGLATVTWSGPQSGVPGQIVIVNVERALWLVAVGLTALVAGYLVGPSKLFRRHAENAAGAVERRFTIEIKYPLGPWVLYALGVSARLAMIATTGRFGYVGDPASAVSSATGYGQALGDLSLCAPLGVAAAALQVFRERRRSARVTLTAMFLCELIFGAAAGGKQNFVIAVLAVVIPFSASRRKLPKGTLIAAAVVFMIVVIPFNQAYRNAARGGPSALSPSETISLAPSILEHTLNEREIVSSLPRSFSYLLLRIREIDSVAIILQRTPNQINYMNPLALVEAPVAAMIPRALWSNKPILTTGYDFSQQYYGLPSEIYTSASITPVGDLFRHGGYLAVIAGMLMLGGGIRLLDDTFDAARSPHAIMLILLFFPIIVKSEADWVTLLAGVPSTIVIWIIAVAVVFPRRKISSSRHLISDVPGVMESVETEWSHA